VTPNEEFALAHWLPGYPGMMLVMGSTPAAAPVAAIDVAFEADIPLDRVLLAVYSDSIAGRTTHVDEADKLALVRAARDEYGVFMRPGRGPLFSIEVVVAAPDLVSIHTPGDWTDRHDSAELITSDSLRWIVALEQRRELYMLSDLARQIGVHPELLAGFTAGGCDLEDELKLRLATVLAVGYGVILYREGEALIIALESPHLFGVHRPGESVPERTA